MVVMYFRKSERFSERSPGSANKVVISTVTPNLDLATLIEYAWVQGATIPGTMSVMCGYIIQFPGEEEKLYTLEELRMKLSNQQKAIK